MTHFFPRPIDAQFYEEVRDATASSTPDTQVLNTLDGLLIDVEAGSVLSFELLTMPQVLTLFAFNAKDPQERIWHQSLISESIFLTPFARIWGTPPKYRPLLTMIDDSLSKRLGPTHRHHTCIGRIDTPAEWRWAGGNHTVRTTWEQFSRLLHERDISDHLITQGVALFQHAWLDEEDQQLRPRPSLAQPGDTVSFFAEIDLSLLAALSPYGDGLRGPETVAEPQLGAVRIGVATAVSHPLGWPYGDAARVAIDEGTVSEDSPGTSSGDDLVHDPGPAVARYVKAGSGRHPHEAGFYDGILERRDDWEIVMRERLEPNTGYGFRVDAGDVFTFEMIEGPQILDVSFLSATDPHEYYATGPQLSIEGGRIGRGTRLWSNPPWSRPMATCILDDVGERVSTGALRDHICHSDCCSPRYYIERLGHAQRSCYENICDGLRMIGLDADCFQGNVNIFMNSAIDPVSGDLSVARSNAQVGDRLEFYAEIGLCVALSVCPGGEGEGGVMHPVVVQVARTGTRPLDRS